MSTTESTAVVRAVREITGDVGIAGGDVQHEGDLRVGGSIGDGVTVQVSGSLTVSGSIEAATIRAGEDITVAGSIVGRGKGLCKSGRSITVRTANGATLEAGRDVVAALELIACRVVTGGALLSEGCRVQGGHITANGGVVCGVLGTSSGTPTVVEAGIDHRLRRLGEFHATEIDSNRKRVVKIRTEIDALMASGKSLSAKQKEMATEVLFNASEIEEQTEALIRSEVTVNSVIHRGVTVRFGGVQAEIGGDITGPVKIWIKPLGHSHQILRTDLKTDTTVPLKTTDYSDNLILALEKAIGVAGKAAA
jgi:uncharacterized protein (DUF342 family)